MRRTILTYRSIRSLILVCATLLTTSAHGQTVIAFANPAPANDTIRLCEGSTITYNGIAIGFSSPTFFWNFTGGTPNSQNTSGPHIVTYNSAGSYYTSLLVTDGINFQTDSVYVIVSNSVPTASYTAPTNSFCSSDNPITLTGGTPLGGEYYGPGVTNGIFDPTAAGAGTHSICYVYTENGGCSDTACETFTVIQGPEAAIADQDIFTPFANCVAAGGSATYTLSIDNTSSTIATNTSYWIDWGDGSAPYSGATLPNGTSHTYTSLGNFPITLVVSSANGCVDTVEYNFFNGQNPNVGIGIGSSQGCVPFTLDVPILNTANNPPGTTYQIEFGDGTVMTFQHPPPDTISYTYTTTSCGTTDLLGNPNSYYVRLRATNPCGTTQAVASPIEVSQAPVLNLQADDSTVCVGQSVQLEDLTDSAFYVSGGNCTFTYSRDWIITPSTGWTISNPSSPNPVVTFQDTGSYEICLAGVHPCGNDTACITICVGDGPVIDVNTTASGTCAPVDVTFNNNSTFYSSCFPTNSGYVVNGTDSAWAAVNGTSIDDDQVDLQFTNPGTYTVTYYAVNDCDSAFYDTTIVVGGPPTLTMPSDVFSCELDTINYGAGGNLPIIDTNNSFVVEYRWHVFPPTGWAYVDGTDSNDVDPHIAFIDTGLYTVCMVVETECGIDSACQTLDFSSGPNILASPDTIICYNSDITIGVGVLGGTAPFSYNWSTAPPSGFSANTDSISLSGLTSTTRYVVTVTDSNGCESTEEVLVTVNPELVVDAGADIQICAGDTFYLDGSVSGGTGPYILSWSPAGLLIDSSIEDPIGIGIYNDTTFYLNVIDSLGCSGMDSVLVSVFQPILEVFAGNDTTYCNSNIVETLQGYTPPGGTWTGNGIVGADGFNPSIAGTGTHQLIYSFTDVNGCYDEDTVLITVVDPVPPVAGPDTIVCVDSDPITLTGTPIGGTWTINGLPSLLSGNTFIPSSVGTFDLYYTTGYGSCEFSDTITIVVNPRPTLGGPFTREICSGDSILFNLTTTIPGSTTEWSVLSTGSVFDVALSGNTSIADTLFNNGSAPDTVVYSMWAIGPAPTDCAGDTTTLTVIVNPLPEITNPVDSFEICSGELFSFVPTSNVAGTDFSISVVSQDLGISGAQSGIDSISDILVNTGVSGFVHYRVIATGPPPTQCNGDTFDVYVEVHPLPTADAGADLNYCSNDSIQIQTVIPAGVSWTWSPTSNLNTATDANPWVTATNTGSTPLLLTYILTVTDSTTGCVNTDTVDITVNPLPPVDAGPNTSICIGDSAIIGTSTAAGFSYNWFIPGGSTFSTSGIITVSPDSTTTYRLIQTNISTGCTDSSEVTVTVIPSPVAGFIAAPDSGCSPLVVTITDTSTIGVSHEWYVNGVLTSNVQNPTFTLSNSSNSLDSTYTIQLIITAGTGCTDTVEQDVVVHPIPNADFSIPSPFCAPDSVTITQNGTYPLGTSFQWGVSSPSVQIVNGTDSIASFVFPDFQGNFDSTYTVWLVATSPFGCTDSLARSVTVNARPTADFSLPSNSCGPTDAQVVNNASGTGLTYVYLANPSAGVVFSDPNDPAPLITFLQSTSDSVVYTIYQQLVDSRGCMDVDSAKITIYPTPTAGFTPSVSDSCGPLTVQFSNVSTPNQTGMSISDMTFEWDLGNGTTSTSQDPSGTYTNIGVNDTSYFVSLIATNAFGCTDTVLDTITVHPNPIADFTGTPSTSCAPFVIDSSVVNVTEYINANDQYIWQVLDPSNGSVLQSFTGPNALSYTLNNDGDTVIIRLIATSPFGCTNDTLEVPFITIEDPRAGFVANPDSGCAPLNVVLTDTSTVGVSHEWFVNGVSFSNQQNPSITLTNSSNQFDSTYTIQLIITAGTGCTDTAVQNVVVHPIPNTDFTIPTPFCAPDSVTAVQNGNYPVGTSFMWGTSSPAVQIINGNDSVASFVFPDFQGNFDSTYTIWLVATSPFGCSDSLSQDVTVYARPTADFSTSLNACGPADISITNNASGTGLTYLYGVLPNTGVSIDDATDPNPTISFPSSTSDSVVYTIYQTVTDSRGCSDLDSAKFTIYPTPTAGFTVNANDSCGPFEVDFINISSPNQAGLVITSMTFNWNFGNGNTSTLQDPTEIFVNSGTSDTTYYVTLIATNSFGCSDTLSDSITVHPDPIALFTGNPQSGCAPFTIDTSAVNLTVHPDANAQYTWEVVDPNSNAILQTYVGEYALNHTILNDGDTVIVRLIASSPFGCANDTLELPFFTIEDPVAGFFANADSSCHPFNAVLTDTSTSGVSHEWFVDGISFSTAQNPSITLTNSGTTGDSSYVITLIVTASSGCSDTTEQILTVWPNPVADFSATEVCEGDGTQFTDLSTGDATVTAWDWNFGDGNSDTVQNPLHNYAAPGTYLVSLSITDNRGCSNFFNDTVIVRPRPTADFGELITCGLDTLCIDLPTTFFDLSTVPSLGGNITTWQWDIDNDGVTDYTSDTVVHIYTTTGNVDVTLIVGTEFGCTDTLTKSYYIQSPPSADFELDTNYGCGPLQVNATNLSTGTITSYHWELYADNGSGGRVVLYSSNSSASGTLPTLQPSNIQDTTYYLELTVGNCCGFDTLTRTATVRSNPSAGLLPDNTLGCSPMSVEFQLDGQVNGSPDYLVLDYGDGTVDTLQRQPLILPNNDTIYVWGAQNHNFIYNGSNLDTTYTSTLYAYNPCGVDSADVNIVVRRATVNAFIDAFPRQGCAPLTVTFANASFRSQNFSWCLDYDTITGNCNQPAVGDTIVYTYTQAGTYTVALFANDNCTYDTTFVTIEVYETPNIQFTANSVCLGDTTHFINGTTIGNGFINSYQWDFGDGSTSFLVNPDHIYANPGTYPVQLIVGTSDGCPDTLVQNVVVHPGPVVDFDPVTLCINEQPFTFNNNSDTLNSNITNISWDLGDGNTSTLFEPTYSYASAGTYDVTLVLTTSNGCIDSVTQQVVINPLPTAAFDTTKVAGGTCGAPQTYLFTDQSVGAVSYLWDFDINNPGINTDTVANPTFSYNSPGVYDVQLVVNNAFSCPDTANVTIVVPPYPTASFSLDSTFGCTPLPVNFTSLSTFNFPTGGISNYYWNFGDGSSTNTSDTAVTHIYTDAGVYDVTLIVENSFGCVDSFTISRAVTVYPRPEADFNYQFNSDGTVQFINTSQFTDGNTTYHWDFGDGRVSSSTSPLHDFDANRYQRDWEFDVCLRVDNPYGCPDSICQTITLNAYRLEVPNAFAPDLTGVGDGNVFLPKGNSIATYHLEIFDAYGNLVFESTELSSEEGIPTESWNGTFMNKGEDELPSGAYVWKISAVFVDGYIWPGKEYDNGRVLRYGTVTLIR